MPDNLLPPQSTNPAISVIIPMYNTEKYIGECLDSLLAQTFQDFEVIIVDDGSTDLSCEVVESYIPKFDERLSLYPMGENTGHPGERRNFGLSHARGEYIYFMDSDDALTKTGLEEMYTLAKNYDADVVHFERYYMSTGVGEEFIKNIHLATRKVQSPPYVEEPTFDSENLADRVQGILNERYWSGPVFKFVRHDLINEHKLFFPPFKPGEDDIWTHGLVFFAKKWLRVPNIVYIRRMRADSITGTIRSDEQALKFWLNPLLLGLKELDRFMEQIEFFRENPQSRYAVLEKHFQGKLVASFRNSGQFNSFEVYEMIKDEFGEKLGKYDVLVSALCTKIFEQNKTLKETQRKLKRAEDISKNVEKYIAAKDDEINKIKSSIADVLTQGSICPEISIIIPMYNSEKYIGELLDSILAQTFQNFEVIVVDDCSTDNSVAVVESYIPKFNKRLKISKTKKNSGNPGEPGNIGVNFSRGKYLFLLDNDDAITPDALEKLYNVAKEYDADVVACERFYKVPEERWNDVEFRKKVTPVNIKSYNYVNKPTLIPFDIAKRVKDCSEDRFLWPLWQKLIRRDIMIENQITFTNSPIQDMLATCCLVYTAEKFVRVPYAIYYYRLRNKSLQHEDREPLIKFKTYLNALNVGFKYLDTFLNDREFFQQNPTVKNLALKTYFHEAWDKYVKEVYDKIPAQDREEALHEEFKDFNNALLTSFLFDALFNIEKEKSSLIMPAFEPFITARVDVELWPKSFTDDVSKLFVSVPNANFLKPSRTKNGIVYQVCSYAGKMEIVAKSDVDGKIYFCLRGLDIRAPEDNSKRVPYWIDYTKLIVKNKVVFNKITSVWHDKPYRYKLDVKAGEEIRAKVEWLPHRSDTIETQIVTTTSHKEAIPEPETSSQKFETARIDIKLSLKTLGDFQILSVSDENATITKPVVLQDKGVGYIITSAAGKLSFVAKATADGPVKLKLRGLDIRDNANPYKRIPQCIEYTALTVNERPILSEITPTWHDKPYIYKTEVKADEELKIQLEWLPRKTDT